MSDYTSVDDLAEYMKMPASVVDASLAQLALDTAEESIEAKLGRKLYANNVTERYHGYGTDELVLKGFPVINIASVKVRSSSLDAGSEQSLTEDKDYTLDADAGILYALSTLWVTGRNNISVKYTYGYDPIPNRAIVVALQMANRIYEFGQEETESTGSWSASHVKGSSNFTNDELIVLENLRR